MILIWHSKQKSLLANLIITYIHQLRYSYVIILSFNHKRR